MLYVYPDVLKENGYISQMKQIWIDSKFDVRGWKEIKVFPRNDNVFIYSFMEDELYSRNRNVLLVFMKLFLITALFKLLCNKMIWIRHNIKPHGENHTPKLYSIFCSWLKLISDNVVIHEKDDRVFYTDVIPHPIYDLFRYSSCQERNIEYLIFGQVKRYKKIEKILDSWGGDRKLLIIGKCNDTQLQREIRAKIDKMNNVDWLDEFISEEKLNDILSRTKYVVMSHEDNSMIVSGSFFHAASFGANIKIANSKFAELMISKFDFVSSDFNNDNYVEPEKVISSLNKYAGCELLIKSWQRILK